MTVRCPSCAFRGNIRIPDHVPRGKSVRVRCARCGSPFSLNAGRLFPQEQAQGYAAIVPESLPCRGERLGNLWVEVKGSPAGRTPLIALPAHPAFSHEILHDLLDGFGEYFQVCYVEFPGSQRNPAEVQSVDYAAWCSDSLPAIKRRLGAARVHLLAHLASAPTALQVAAEQPEEIASLTLLEPDLCLAGRLRRARAPGELSAFRDGHLEGVDREELTLALLSRVWELPLEDKHLKGLSHILGAGLSPELLCWDLREYRALPYRRLSRLQVPVLVFSARDQKDRSDALYLQATLTAVEPAALEKGGAMAAWFGSTWFASKLQAFKRAADAAATAGPAVREGARQGRRRSQTLNGQPAGWLLFLYALLAAGLTAAGSRLRFEPAYLQQLLPQLLAGLLPILWLLVPRRVNPMSLLRFRGFSLGSVAVPLLAGVVLGAAFRILLAAAPGLADPAIAGVALPPPLARAVRVMTLMGGGQGQFAGFAAAGIAALLVYGAAANLLVLRRSPHAVWLPALVFCLFPAGWPELLWRLPAAVLGAVLFTRSLSIFGPLFLLAGVAVGSQLNVPQGWLQHQLVGLPARGAAAALAVTVAALTAAAVVLVLLLGGRGRPIDADKRYYAATLNRPGRLLRWEPALGTVLIAFSAIAAAAAVFLSLAI
jgi:hypothetical protein